MLKYFRYVRILSTCKELVKFKEIFKVANIKSAKKRVLVNKRQKAENRYIKAALNTEIKKFRLAIVSGDLAGAEAQLKVVESDIMSAKSKGILHANTASRKVARLKSALSNATATTATEEVKVEAKVEEKVEEVKEEVKAPAKKTTTRKTTTKKAETAEESAKKAPAKKTTTKTTTAKKTTTKKAE